MAKKWMTIGLVLLLALGGSLVVSARADDTEPALAKESEVYCAETAKDKATAPIIMDKVKQAVALLEKEGASAFPKFKGKNSEFIFNGTYIWVHSADGKMLMHPIKPELVGKDVLSIKDSDGHAFFEEMNKLVDQRGDGWVEYKWPKPGQKESSVKVSYVHGATVDGKKVIVGCGVYDLTMKDVGANL